MFKRSKLDIIYEELPWKPPQSRSRYIPLAYRTAIISKSTV